ncbi:uncharacterized protein [Rutidosis leptorrhynchoides]|uniref:uncharacterized protein n=1 Tax=Rutidosis leptorrhynchoides TaxID=125765 RepID=UPI003A99B60E
MADQHLDATVESSDSKGAADRKSDSKDVLESSAGVIGQQSDEGVSIADVAINSLKSESSESQHSDKDSSTDNFAVTSLKSTKMADERSNEGVNIADVTLDSVQQHSDKDSSATNVAVESSELTSMAVRHLDEVASIADVALESLKSKGAENQNSNTDLSADNRSLKPNAMENQEKGSSKDHLESSSVKNQHSEKSSSTDHIPVTSLELTGVENQHADEGVSIADVALKSMKSEDDGDKKLDEGTITSKVNTETSESKGSGSNFEISVKTLDSQLRSFNVDKNMIVSALKEKIATEVGLSVDQQRLIFRGKMLKDDDPLSEYHVESGHTLHLVSRQTSEFQPSSGSPNAETPASSINTGVSSQDPRVGHAPRNVVLGTFGANDQDADGNQDISQVIGAVLNSIGMGGQAPIGSIGTTQPNMQFSIGENVNNHGQTGNQSQPAVPTLTTPIPESLYTISEFMNHMERAFSQNGYQPSNSTPNSPTVELPSNSHGLLSPAALAVVLRQAQRLLSGPALDSLSHTIRRLEEDEGSSDVTVRTQIQTEAMQSGLAMQHLGALLLELGRTMLTLRIGQSPAESSVNAGPAVYISSSGPNPIMVQPFPLQTNSLFGDHANSTANHGAFGPIGIGSVPRQFNIHIHAIRNIDNLGEPDARLPDVRTDTGGRENVASNSMRTKSLSEREGGSSTNRKSNTPGNASGIPLGLGSGGLQPKRRHRQTRSEVATGGQMDPTTIINQVMQNPAALNSLLQNPAMMNTVNQLAQQVDGNQDLGSMLGGSSGSLDMSNIVQQMMPFVSQSLNRGSSSSNLLQSAAPSRKGTLHRRYSSVKSLNVKERSSKNDFQMNLENAAQKIVEQYPPLEIFSSIVETVAALHNNVFDQGALDELCMQEELAQEFNEMLKLDISRRLQGGRR